MSQEAKWYVIHTYSGYENKVATTIEKAVENRKLQDLIHAVKIPGKGHRNHKQQRKRS
jgi:transcriptional antiterminator NusG